MPYIKDSDRANFTRALVALPTITTPGELTYVLTKICHHYLDGFHAAYSDMSQVIAALECAKLEFYRVVMAPYEDRKRKENGSIGRLDREGV